MNTPLIISSHCIKEKNKRCLRSSVETVTNSSLLNLIPNLDRHENSHKYNIYNMYYTVNHIQARTKFLSPKVGQPCWVQLFLFSLFIFKLYIIRFRGQYFWPKLYNVQPFNSFLFNHIMLRRIIS